MKKKRNLTSKFNKMRLQEKMMWKKKAKVKWLREEDQNKFYFQKMASCRRHANVITSSMVGLRWDSLVAHLMAAISEEFNRHFFHT